MENNDQISDDFTDATTAELSRHVQIWNLTGSL